VLPDRAYRIPPLKVDVVSPAGSGDAVLAGLAGSIYRGQPIEEGLRLGFAAATAVVLLPGTADCRRNDVERFLPQIELIPYEGENALIQVVRYRDSHTTKGVDKHDH